MRQSPEEKYQHSLSTGEMLPDPAQAEVMRPGRTLTIVRSDVSAFEDGKETLCATAVVTLIRLAGKSDHAAG